MDLCASATTVDCVFEKDMPFPELVPQPSPSLSHALPPVQPVNVDHWIQTKSQWRQIFNNYNAK